MLKKYDKEKNDIIVIGRHGAFQLAQRGIPYKKYYKLPVYDQNINTMPIVREVQKYQATFIFYQEYVTLMEQKVGDIELVSAVRNKTVNDDSKYVINEKTYIFEPDAQSVAEHLEFSMTQIAISQLILSSKLAQYASRFKAMTASKERSINEKQEIHLQYSRTKRAIKDERLKEIINGLKKNRLGTVN
jgi:F0F1-type ATP synthase gamma subunit